MRAERDSMDQEILYILRHLHFRALYLLSGEMQIGLHTVVLTQPEILVTINQILYVLITLFRNSDDCRCLTRDSITHVTAFHTRQTCLEISDRIFQETEQQLDRIRSLQMDIATRVTAFATFQRHFQRDITLFGLYRLIRERSLRIDTSGATHV